MSEPKPEILVGATFTASPLDEPLAFWLRELKLPHKVDYPGYQQLFQLLLDPSSSFGQNRKGANVALFRLEDLGAGDQLQRNAEELIEALIAASARFAVPLMVCLCPASESLVDAGRRQRIHSLIKGHANLYPMDADRLIADYEVATVNDALAERAGHIPYTREFYTALATGIIRTVTAIDRKPIKVTAFDCDNTIWTGVCGEDGPAGVVIDEGRRVLQERLVEQRQSGRLLVAVSKNNESDVEQTFEARAGEMPLEWRHITTHKINWEAKSSNLLALSEELALGLDSFVFLEDDSKECAEVREDCPEVVTLQIPADSGDLPHFLRHAWVLDSVKTVTGEDRRRSQFYADQAARKRLEGHAKNLREFLASLNLEVLISPITLETLPRVAQLTQRTNQMNFTLDRYTERELGRALENGLRISTVTVSDRFGSYGLVGAVFSEMQGSAYVITNLLLSCRALGRGVEHRMLAHAAQTGGALGVSIAGIAVRRGPRNQPAFDFLASALDADFRAGLALVEDETTILPVPLHRLKAVEHRIGEAIAKPAIENAHRPASKVYGPEIDYQRIAAELNTAQHIQEAMDRAVRKQAERRSAVGDAPQTELELRLAEIWCDLLNLSAVGVNEDFFDLGGHSLLAVQLLSRIHNDLGTDLPDSVIYAERLNIANLARTVELAQLGVEDQERYLAALAEIEGLSDEEVEAMLAAEEARGQS